MKPLIARIAMVLFLVLAFSALVLAKEGPGPQGAQPAGRTVSADRDAAVDQSARSLAKLSLHFVENQGQWDDKSVRFATWRKGVAAAFREETIRLFLGGTSLGLTFEGASKKVSLEGEEKHETRYNFFIGDDPGKWREAVPVYGALLYRGLYPGVDVRVREAAGQLEYDLLLAPGADLTKVVVRVDGASAFEIGKDGVMTLKTAAGPLRQTPPKSWEVLPSGERRPIESRFRKIDEKRYGFEVPGRDRSLAMVIDPGLEWSTFLGGSYSDFIGPVAPAQDGSGDFFLGGTTNSPDFPLLSDPSFTFFQTRAFVARINSSGSSLAYATFFGGWLNESVKRGLAVDAAGNAVLVGRATSPDFPTTAGAFDQTCDGDGFVVRLNPTGGLIFSTCLGGNAEDYATAVAYDPSGAIIVGGYTHSTDFPTTAGAFDRTYNTPNAPADGGLDRDMFLARLTPDGTQLTYGTYLGGPSQDELEALVVDANGVVTVAGWSTGNNVQVFVSTPDAFDTTWNGNQDAVIARLKLDGASSADLKYATLLGGQSVDNFYAVALDPTNPEWVTFGGVSASDNFPVTPGVVRTTNPPLGQAVLDRSGLLVRFRFPATGAPTLVWSTYHHGDEITDVAVNEAGQPIAVGLTDDTPTSPLLTTLGAFDRTVAGVWGGDAFVSRLDANATQYLYQSYLGGQGSETGGLFADPQISYLSGNTVIISGRTTAPDFPTTTGAYDRTFAVTNDPADIWIDGFVAKFTTDPDASGDLTANPPTPVSPPDGATFRAGGKMRLEWSAVTDLSGVEAYQFEVSVDPSSSFSAPIYRGSTSGTEVLLPPTGQGLGNATHFWRVRTADRAGNFSAWSTVRSFTTNSNNTGETTLNAVQVYPTSVVGGTQVTGNLILYDPAPSGGLAAKLSAHLGNENGINPAIPLPVPVTIPATVTIPAGGVSVPFTINTLAVSRTHTVYIVATINGVGRQVGFTIIPSGDPAPNKLSLDSRTVQGGTGATGTVTLAGKAPAGGTTVSLSSSHPAAASVPAAVTVAAGATSASFSITTSPVSTAMDVRIEARVGSNISDDVLHVRPPGQPTLNSVTVSPTTIAGGASATGTLTFSGPLPTGSSGAPDTYVTVTSSDPAVLGVLSNLIIVPAGSTSHTFGIFTTGPAQARSVTVSATYNGVTRTQGVTVNAAPAVTVSSLTPNVTTLNGGQGGNATVTLAAPVSTATLISLSTDHPEAFDAFPATLIISNGVSDGNFSYTASKAVTAAIQATITASFGASSRSATLTINPPPPPTPPITSLSLNPTSVGGGGSSTGTVTLQSAAPTGGAVVTLLSNNAAATVPPSVTVPAGAATANFTVTTSTVSSNTTVQITGLLHLTAIDALTVTTGQPNTPPTITSTPVTTANVGQAYSYQATATGTTPITWSLVTGPSGMTIGSSTGLVSWTPSATGSFPVTIRATNSVGSNDQSYTITVGNVSNTGLRSPTANAAETSSAGDNNGYQTTPANAHADDTANAVDTDSGTTTSTSCTDAGKDKHRFYNYGFTIDSGATINGIEVRLDARADSTSGSPRICIQLSWNGGTTWTTAQQTATLGTTMATFTLGSATNTWGRTWSVNDFSNANFRVRVIDVASSTSRDFTLDWVAVRVHFTPGAPTAPTITSTPVTTANVGQAYSYQATATGTTPITWSLVTGPSGMTIGSSTGLVSWTPSATGSFPVTIRATNSVGSNDQSYTIIVTQQSDTGLRSPTTNAAETSSAGDNNGFQSTPANAHADDTLNAVDTDSGSGTSTSCTNTGKDKHRFYNYGFSIPTGSTIRGIEVRLDARVDSTSGTPAMCVQLSWDGGVTWTAAKSTPTLGTTMATFTLGSATDTWGRSWGVGDFSDANFRVRIINVASSTSRDFTLDWVAVRVHH